MVVFTEYAHTVDWLTRVLNQKGYTDDRLAVIQGSTATDDREYIRSQFTADPRQGTSSRPARHRRSGGRVSTSRLIAIGL